MSDRVRRADERRPRAARARPPGAGGDAQPGVAAAADALPVRRSSASTERDGRLADPAQRDVPHGFGNVDLDLRQATLEGDVVTIVALGAFGTVDVYVPEGVEVDLRAFALFGHARARGRDCRRARDAAGPRVRTVAVGGNRRRGACRSLDAANLARGDQGDPQGRAPPTRPVSRTASLAPWKEAASVFRSGAIPRISCVASASSRSSRPRRCRRRSASSSRR